MKAKGGPAALLALTVAALVFSAFFILLGAPIIRVIRNVYGATIYWFIGMLATGVLLGLQLFPIALIVGSLWTCIGVYCQLEEKGYANFWTGLLATLIGTSLVLAAPGLILSLSGVDLVGLLRENLDSLIASMNARPRTFMGDTELSSELLLQQVPSIVFLLNALSLAMALIFDLRVANIFNVRFERIAGQIRLLEFRLPDVGIWVLMFAFLFSFIKIDNQVIPVVAGNVFNAMIGLYLLQGLAIAEVAFISWKIGPLWKALIYFLVIGQFFLVLSFVGIIDFWIDIRAKLRKVKPSGNFNHKESI